MHSWLRTTTSGDTGLLPRAPQTTFLSSGSDMPPSGSASIRERLGKKGPHAPIMLLLWSIGISHLATKRIVPCRPRKPRSSRYSSSVNRSWCLVLRCFCTTSARVHVKTQKGHLRLVLCLSLICRLRYGSRLYVLLQQSSGQGHFLEPVPPRLDRFELCVSGAYWGTLNNKESRIGAT
jgi:hypothetical protein